MQLPASKRVRRWLRAGLVAVPALGAAVLAICLGAAAPELWDLPGASREALVAGARAAPANWRTLVAFDFLLILAVLVTLAAGIAVTAPGWRQWSPESWRGRHLCAAAVATFGYALADAVENVLLHSAVSTIRSGGGVDDGEVRRLAVAMACKWGLLVVAILLVAALWPRRAPEVEAYREEWGPPDDRPSFVPLLHHPWDPHPARFGISVSGGGIRSASFALGVLQVLRARGLLKQARYVTSVSGGSYTTSALTAMNQRWTDANGDAPIPDDGFRANSPEEQRLRRSLRYLATDRKVLLGAIARIVFGLLLNLWLLYLLTFAVVRPIGWLLGTPFVQRGLRVEEPFVVSVAGTSTDPDDRPSEQPYKECSLFRPPDETRIARIGPAFTIAGDPEVTAHEVALDVPQQCVRLVDPPDTERDAERLTLAVEHPGVVAIVDGEVEVRRQPVVTVADPERRDLVDVVQPVLGVTPDLGGLAADADADDVRAVLTVDRPASVTPASILDRRGPMDIDMYHWVLPLAFFGLAVLALGWRILIRPSNSTGVNTVATVSGGIGVALALVLLVLPWLVDSLPRAVSDGLAEGPAEGAFGDLPIDVRRIPALLAWPLLSIVSVTRFLGARKGRQPDTKPRARNARAFSKKYFGMLRQLLVGVLLAAVAVVTAVNILTVGAISGPGAQIPWLSREVLGNDLVRWFPPDLVLWGGIVLALVLTRATSESTSWSPAPIYKRRLAWAFAWARLSDREAKRREYGGNDRWADLESRTDLDTDDTAGFVDGKIGNGTELVLCCAANVLGEDRAPTGRRAVSFTASRTHLGGPEIGWIRTRQYIARMGPRRKWDINLPGITALSGAAVSPAMGKAALGPVGSILAILNVRLGAWLPHPGLVRRLGADVTWRHNPGWPWYWREVIRRYRSDAPYLYVTDGGHWENLGLVEALRRGCTTIVAVSAAGDGELSHATLAEAIEIARSDLGVDIQLDEVWQLRPKIGGDPETTLESGRQYILEPGPASELGRVAPQGFAFGTFRYPSGDEGEILLLEATMVDGLPVDVHAYAEGHPEFPNTSTGDQLFDHRDFESYRTLGRTIVEQALDTRKGRRLVHRIEKQCDREAT